MLKWIQSLLPREDRVFDLFAEHSRIVLAGAEALKELIDGSPGGIARATARPSWTARTTPTGLPAAAAIGALAYGVTALF